MKIRFLLCSQLTVLIMLFTAQIKAFAYDNISITAVISDDTQISAYINTETSDCTAMLGTTQCEIISYNRSDSLPSDTLILVDTSGSIPEDIQKKTGEILSALIDGKKENERYAIASFGTEINYLCDYTSDRYELSKAAGILEYSEEYTYIYSTLDSALKNISDSVFTKIIIISDGVENSKDGITYDEVLRTVSDTLCPVYTLGIENNNQESLKKFYSFARNSSGKSFNITSDTNVSEVCGVLNECRNYTCVTVKISDGLADGSIKYLKISGIGFDCGCDVRMPVAAVSENTDTEISVEATEIETNVTYADPTAEEKSINYILIAAVGAAVIVIAVIVIFFGVKSKKKDPPVPVPKPYDSPGDIPTLIDPKPMEYFIKLTDINAPENSFRHPLGNGVVIGRNPKECMIAISYDGYIARRHCRIYRSGDKIFIENLSQSQGVVINDKFVLDKVENLHEEPVTPTTSTKMFFPSPKVLSREISSGDIIRLGHTSLRFEIIELEEKS